MELIKELIYYIYIDLVEIFNVDQNIIYIYNDINVNDKNVTFSSQNLVDITFEVCQNRNQLKIQNLFSNKDIKLYSSTISLKVKCVVFFEFCNNSIFVDIITKVLLAKNNVMKAFRL